MYQQTVTDVLKTHRSRCKRLVDTRPEFVGLQDYRPENHPGVYSFHVNCDGQAHYKLKPLFCALMIFVDDPVQKYDELLVKLIRTGLDDGLSAPISFDSIKSEIESQSEDGSVVTVRIQTAIRFVMDLDEREKQAFPDKEYEEALKKRSLDFLEDLIEDEGYDGEDPGLTTMWVDNSKSGVVVPRGTIT